MPDQVIAGTHRGTRRRGARAARRGRSPRASPRAVTPTVTRFAAENIALPLETEPASFVVVQRKDAGR